MLHEVEQICSRVAVLNRGELLAQGPVDELVRKDELSRSFLRAWNGHPVEQNRASRHPLVRYLSCRESPDALLSELL